LEEVEIASSRDSLSFSATTSGYKTGPQTIAISNLENGLLNWSVSDDASWLTCAPLSGAGSGVVSVSVDPSSLPVGAYDGTITISDPGAANSPVTVPVTLTVYGAETTAAPFGEFSTPVAGSTVMSSIPVTGWALDDIGVESIKIYRGETGNLVYIGDASFVEGSRPDVEGAFPDYPMGYKAGWGYMLLTYFLPDGGNGTFKLHAIAADSEGKSVTLGVKIITCDNAHAVKPFGAIDTPTQGGMASGTSFINWGWALTPRPNSIKTDSSTIGIYIDGVYIGRPTYNVYRGDIAGLFPGYANTGGAIGYYSIDTTAITNGIHTIAWIVSDNGGNSDGIGSRYFTIQNSGPNDQVGRGAPACAPVFDSCSPFFDPSSPVFDPYSRSLTFDEIKTVEIQELERVEINLSDKGVSEGYLVVGDQLRGLPIGSTLDKGRGVFYWQPGPGFIGEYSFVFLRKDEAGRYMRRNVIIRIEPGTVESLK
jgi:hypothetical protein